MEKDQRMTPLKRVGVLLLMLAGSYLILGMIPYWIGNAIISNPLGESIASKWIIGILLMIAVFIIGATIYFLGRWIMTGRAPLILVFLMLLLSSCGRYGYVVQSPTGQKYYTKKVKKKNGCITFKTRNGRQYVMGKYKIEKIKR